jgi:hypothetical protein
MKKLIVGGGAVVAVLLAGLWLASCEQQSGAVTAAKEQEQEKPWWEGLDDGEKEPPPVVVGIQIVSMPDMTLYGRNEEFRGWDGLAVHRLWSDGSLDPEPLPETAYTLSNEATGDDTVDTGQAGPKYITVKAGEYTAEFQIYVTFSISVLRSMSATPSLVEYYLGEQFRLADVAISGEYNDGTKTVTNGVAVEGYDAYRRGVQEVTLRVNNVRTTVQARVKIPGAAGVTLGFTTEYRNAFIKGKDFDIAASGLKARVSHGNISVTLKEGDGLYPSDITKYDKNKAGEQSLQLTLDDKSAATTVSVLDVKPAVWFDLGYWRHEGDPDGIGPGEGRFYTRPNEKLVIAPIRYLIGWNDDHSPAEGTSYDWYVDGVSQNVHTETFAFTPSATGTYTVKVEVRGRSFIDGSTTTKEASVPVVCHTGTVATSKAPIPKNGYGARVIRNFAPGQFTMSGTGYGWSLGAWGGYAVWQVNKHQEYYVACGNTFGGWNEPGIVWMQEDRNNNGIADEMWYEIKGSHDSPANTDTLGREISRRYAITYVNYGGTGGSTNSYGQIINRHIYWADGKGRAGRIQGGWSGVWGVTGNWVTFAGTLLMDDGKMDTANYGKQAADTAGYVDTGTAAFYHRDAIDAAGAPVTLTNVRFLKVHTAVFCYGSTFGDISTELTDGTDLGFMTDFPLP